MSQNSISRELAYTRCAYPTDRFYEAAQLGFDSVVENSLDAVADRDHVVELLSDFSLLMAHLSRLSEELVLWSSFEFKYVELSDDFTTGSSIMPQKKNPDMAELARGKTGRVYGDLIAMLTVLKGLPLAYNKDMQEDKECFFDAVDTVNACLDVFIPMIKSMKANTANMLAAAKDGYINATDLADYLAKKGLPFREAYKLVGEIVRDSIDKKVALEDISLADYKKYSDLFEEDLYEDISIVNCVNKRTSYGGTAVSSVEKQIALVREKLSDKKSVVCTTIEKMDRAKVMKFATRSFPKISKIPVGVGVASAIGRKKMPSISKKATKQGKLSPVKA